ncbi:MAG: lipopolysaccharide heptosyltransferase I [Betaproteobacteria bacterium HGW-Betaproteobacteria-7]|jgi:heptosyltransferase-1|nr:MAG: lipopolysaccharide heptosyltransferase I [Betaproteobacteria bacterium HGW-Betaproteobacteria-7]
MRILIVKTSSLGDVIHNLPVIDDIRQHFPDAIIDWCVEDSFAAIPRLHPGVVDVLPVAIRRWRKSLCCRRTWQEIIAARGRLRAQRYDLVIDTQGLLKSALVVSQVDGKRCGYDAASAREMLATCFYERRFAVSASAHAVVRNRQLVGAALGYTPQPAPDYGITAAPATFDWLPPSPYVVFLTATSRDDKLWPEEHWLELGRQLYEQGCAAVLPAGSAPERERAARLAAGIPGAVAAPPLNIPQLAALLAGARSAVGVDTGLTHLAVALKVPTVALYTATDPGLTGVYGTAFHCNLGGKGQVPSAGQVLEQLSAA